MSIIVRGMEMSKNCYECKMWSMCWKSRPQHNMIKSVCPLLELPPHGRLIDADKLKSRLVLENGSSELKKIGADILKWIDIQETVIEAEGSET